MSFIIKEYNTQGPLGNPLIKKLFTVINLDLIFFIGCGKDGDLERPELKCLFFVHLESKTIIRERLQQSNSKSYSQRKSLTVNKSRGEGLAGSTCTYIFVNIAFPSEYLIIIFI